MTSRDVGGDGVQDPDADRPDPDDDLPEPAADLATLEALGPCPLPPHASDEDLVAILAQDRPAPRDMRSTWGAAARVAHAAGREPRRLPPDAVRRLNALALHPDRCIRDGVVRALFALADPSSLDVLGRLRRVQEALPDEKRTRATLVEAALRRCARTAGEGSAQAPAGQASPAEPGPRIVLAARDAHIVQYLWELAESVRRELAPGRPATEGTVSAAPRADVLEPRADVLAPQPDAPGPRADLLAPPADVLGSCPDEPPLDVVEVRSLEGVAFGPDDVLVVQHEMLTEADREALVAAMSPPGRRVAVVVYDEAGCGTRFVEARVRSLERLERRRIAYARRASVGRVAGWARAALLGDRSPGWCDARPWWPEMGIFPGAGQITTDALRRCLNESRRGPFPSPGKPAYFEVAVCLSDREALERLREIATERGFRLVLAREPRDLLDRAVAVVQRAVLDPEEWRAFVHLVVQRATCRDWLPLLAIATSGESRDAHESWLDLVPRGVAYHPQRSFALGRWLEETLDWAGNLYI